MSDVAAAENAGTEIPGEVLAKATEMGWKPKEDWVGDDSGWVDADEFIEKQESRAQAAALTENKELKEQVATLRTEQAETRQTLEEFKEHRSKTEQRMYDRALKDIQAKQREAVEAGDTDAFDVAAQEQDQLLKDAAKPDTKTKDGTNADDIPAYKDWKGKNPWYLDDIEMTEYADRIAPTVARKGKFTETDRAFYDAIGEEVKKKFPDKFENPNRKKAAAVEGEGANITRKTGKGYDSLPPEAKEACDRYIKQGLYVDENKKALTTAKAREEYCAIYYEKDE